MRELPGGQVAKLCVLNAGAQIQPLVRELRAHIELYYTSLVPQDWRSHMLRPNKQTLKKHTWDITSHLSECLQAKRTQTNVGECILKRETSYVVVRNVNWYNHCGNSKVFSQKIKNRSTIYSFGYTFKNNETPLPGIY